MATRDFHLGDILSITTGILVSPRKMDGVSDIMEFMTGQQLATLGLAARRKDCAVSLLTQHPQLADVESFADMTPAEADQWLDRQVARFGENLPVTTL